MLQLRGNIASTMLERHRARHAAQILGLLGLPLVPRVLMLEHRDHF